MGSFLETNSVNYFAELLLHALSQGFQVGSLSGISYVNSFAWTFSMGFFARTFP